MLSWYIGIEFRNGIHVLSVQGGQCIVLGGVGTEGGGREGRREGGRRCFIQASMELGPEDVSLLERWPHFRGWYVQASMELGPEEVSLLERCPPFIFLPCLLHNKLNVTPQNEKKRIWREQYLFRQVFKGGGATL